MLSKPTRLISRPVILRGNLCSLHKNPISPKKSPQPLSISKFLPDSLSLNFLFFCSSLFLFFPLFNHPESPRSSLFPTRQATYRGTQKRAERPCFLFHLTSFLLFHPFIWSFPPIPLHLSPLSYFNPCHYGSDLVGAGGREGELQFSIAPAPPHIVKWDLPAFFFARGPSPPTRARNTLMHGRISDSATQTMGRCDLQGRSPRRSWPEFHSLRIGHAGSC